MTSAGSTCRVYESTALREAGDGLLRPGGLGLTQRAIAASDLAPGSRVADIGCGTGATLHYLVEGCGYRAVGIELSEINLAAARGRSPGLPLIRASGAYLPFVDAILDGVLAECSLSVIGDLKRVLGECSRVLKDKGMLLMHDVYARNPHAQTDLKGLSMECCLTGAVSKEEWIARVESRGFQVTLWEDHTPTLKEFAARLIFSCGSLEAFWCRARGQPNRKDAGEIHHAVASARPGYFLLAARRLLQS